MQTIRQEEDFKPVQRGLRFWLATRKSGMKVSGFYKSPGIFKTEQFTIDLLLFLLAVGLESYGLFKIFEYTGEIPVLAGLLLGDIVIAVFAHIPRGKIKRCNNKIWLEDFKLKFKLFDENGLDAAGIQGQINKDKNVKMLHRFWEYGVSLLIFGICIVKIVTFLTQSGYGVFDPESRFILISYIVVAIIHVYATGYCLAAITTQVFFFTFQKSRHFSKRRNGEFTNNNSIKEGSFIVFEFSENINEFNENLKAGLIKQESQENRNKHEDEKIKIKKHVLLKVDEELKCIIKVLEGIRNFERKNGIVSENQNRNYYVLYTWGLLDDSHVREIIQAQVTESAKRLSLYSCIKKQMDQLNGEL
jgi:hypothetical protein